MLRPGSPFREEMIAFHQGKPRWECSELFLINLGVFRLIPVIETTIEEKHARATFEAARHTIGPVRLSLANRLPLLERSLTRQPELLTQFLQSLERTRQFYKMPSHFGFASHPIFAEQQSPSTWKLTQHIASILYHCDIEAQTRTLQPAMAVHVKDNRKRIREVIVLSKPETKHAAETQVLHVLTMPAEP